MTLVEGRGFLWHTISFRPHVTAPAGYVSLGSKRLFYYFVLSQRSPSTDPVVLWLNGGGACVKQGS